MCSVFGCTTNGVVEKLRISGLVTRLINNSTIRGRDGLGVYFTHVEASDDRTRLVTTHKVDSLGFHTLVQRASEIAMKAQAFTMIGNARAEPTTEWVKDKSNNDQQPYKLGGWTIVHNGTIANDKDLRTCDYPSNIDSAAIVERLAVMKCYDGMHQEELYAHFIGVVKRLKGSYAILAVHEKAPGVIFTACNYRPLWWGKNGAGLFIASEARMLPGDTIPQMIEPYTCNVVSYNLGIRHTYHLIEAPESTYKRKALVIASGGMDSTVAAQMCLTSEMDVTLINFQYGCRAESNELKAIRAIATRMDVPLVLFPIPIYDPKDSPLFDVNAEIAGGEAGAEFAHEWVPARNLVMLAVATAYAEANGFDYIVLGNNLEEAGAYPDNEPEFINRFNSLLPFAVGDGKRVRVLMPVGNLMKHEIVAAGLAHGAPLDLTWSCYRNGEHHCGTCGPCMMRKTAFAISSEPEVIKYQNEV